MRVAALGVAVAVLLGLVTSRPVWGVFHIAVIDEVMSGVCGDPTLQYVEIRMLAGGQNFVAHTRLSAFDCDGSNHSVLLEVPSDVPTGTTDGRWIMASASPIAGITPDFTFPAGILSPCGMVCWGAPGITPPNPPNWDPADPNNYVDCVAYGGYTGPKSFGVGTPTGLSPGDGIDSLTRTGNSANNSADFALQTPTPTNNAAQAGSFPTCNLPTTTSTTLATTTSVPGASTSTTLATTTSVPGASTTTTTTTPLPGLPPALSGGPPRKVDCLAEWRVVGAVGTRPVITCHDGDPACDTGDAPGCFFQAVVCFDDDANALYGGKCAAGPVTSFALGTHIRTTLDSSNASAVLDAVAALGSTLAGERVTFTATIDGLRCTAPFNLTVVPKIAHGKPRKGVRVLRSKTVTATKTDRDMLRLVCTP